MAFCQNKRRPFSSKSKLSEQHIAMDSMPTNSARLARRPSVSKTADSFRRSCELICQHASVRVRRLALYRIGVMDTARSGMKTRVLVADDEESQRLALA